MSEHVLHVSARMKQIKHITGHHGVLCLNVHFKDGKGEPAARFQSYIINSSPSGNRETLTEWNQDQARTLVWSCQCESL